MTDTGDCSAADLRSQILAAALDRSAGSIGKYHAKKPMKMRELRKVYEAMTGSELDDRATALKAKGEILREAGLDPDWEERGTGPFRKDELRAISNCIEPSDDDAWNGLIGSVEGDDKSEDRVFQEPDPTSQQKRYLTLIALARYGPGTASEIAQITDKEDEIVDIDWSTVESELPRLYKTQMADRSKRPGFDDVYTYWLTPEGERVLMDNGNWSGANEGEHRDHQKVYSQA